MPAEKSSRIPMLRMLMMMDAVVLFGLGVLFMAVPRRIEAVFHFTDLPAGVDYIVGLLGCVFASLGIGYALAAPDPQRNRAFVQMGILRGVLEVAFGAWCASRGTITWAQAWFGIAVAAAMAITYTVLYPGKEAE